MKLSDNQLVSKISENLTDYQNVLIAKALTGRTEEQGITPSVTLTLDELRKITSRSRIRTAFLDKLVGLLEDEGLEVETYADCIVVTKPAEDLETEFESFREMDRFMKELRKAS